MVRRTRRLTARARALRARRAMQPANYLAHARQAARRQANLNLRVIEGWNGRYRSPRTPSRGRERR